MRIDILTLFPQMFDGPFRNSIRKRAVDCALVVRCADAHAGGRVRRPTDRQGEDRATGGGFSARCRVVLASVHVALRGSVDAGLRYGVFYLDYAVAQVGELAAAGVCRAAGWWCDRGEIFRHRRSGGAGCTGAVGEAPRWNGCAGACRPDFCSGGIFGIYAVDAEKRNIV